MLIDEINKKINRIYEQLADLEIKGKEARKIVIAANELHALQLQVKELCKEKEQTENE